jgi:hypothetical protein
MGGVYKIKKGCGCKMCKPHKGGHTPKHKKKDRVLHEEHKKDMANGRE